MNSSDEKTYVTRKGTEQPVGYILNTNNGTTMVRWGFMDGKAYDEEIETSKLVIVDYKIFTPEEVLIRQAKEAGGHFQEGDSNG